jgi:hypothetical protein
MEIMRQQEFTFPAKEKKMQEKFGFKSHWRKFGITTGKGTEVSYQIHFDKHDHQQQVLIGLYQMVFPDWDQIFKIHGYPNTGEDLWKFICRQFQEFDRTHHPNCMPGGIWMNNGFSANHVLEDWEISFENCLVEYNEQIQTEKEMRS